MSDMKIEAVLFPLSTGDDAMKISPNGGNLRVTIADRSRTVFSPGDVVEQFAVIGAGGERLGIFLRKRV